MKPVAILGDNEIILVDDDEIEIMIARRNLERSQLSNPLLAFQSGSEFLAHMRHVKAKARPTPSLVLLDLRMPLMDGFEVLEQLRADVAFREIPLLIFSNSNYDGDATRAARLGADGYWLKPNSSSEYIALFDRLAVTRCAGSAANGAPRPRLLR